jgi:hypothetical protein
VSKHVNFISSSYDNYCEILGSHGGEDVKRGHLRCDAVRLVGGYHRFRGN